jgi:hypothetical protein
MDAIAPTLPSSVNSKKSPVRVSTFLLIVCRQHKAIVGWAGWAAEVRHQ